MPLQIDLIGIGLAAGVLAGLTGLSSGSLLAPALVILGVRPAVAIGSSLMVMAVNDSLRSAMIWRRGSVDTGLLGTLATGSVPGVLAGWAVLYLLAQAGVPDVVYTRLVAGGLVLASVIILLGKMGHIHLTESADARPVWALRALGFGAGVTVSLLAMGSILPVAVVLSMLLSHAFTRLWGTAMLHSALMTSVATLGHGFFGHVDLQVVGNILLGLLPAMLAVWRVRRSTPVPAVPATVSAALLLVGVGLGGLR